MNALVLRKDFKPVNIEKERSYIDSYEGFLNSSYKQVAKTNFFDAKPNTILGIKQRIRSYQYAKDHSAEVVIKLGFFAVVLAAILI